MQKYYFEKVVQSGKLVERYRYEKPVSVKRSTREGYIKPVGRAKKADAEGKRLNRVATIRRARKTVERSIHSNCYQWYDDQGTPFLPVFMTLTFTENIEDVQEANKRFKAFIKRLNYYVYKQKVGRLKYVATLEFQERGSIHYHCVFFNLPFVPVDELERIWGQGNVHVSIVKSVGKVANYLIKTMRIMLGDDRLAGHKCYLVSRGLNKSQKVINETQINRILAQSDQTYYTEFENDYYGNMAYERRKLRDRKKRK